MTSFLLMTSNYLLDILFALQDRLQFPEFYLSQLLILQACFVLMLCFPNSSHNYSDPIGFKESKSSILVPTRNLVETGNEQRK